MDYNQSSTKSGSNINTNTSKNSNIIRNNNFNLPPTNNIEKKFSEITGEKKSNNNVFYTNSIINAAKNATKSIIRSNSTSSIAHGKNEPNVGSTSRNINLPISNNFTENFNNKFNHNNDNSNNQNNLKFDINLTSKKNSFIEGSNFNNNLIKNLSNGSNLTEKSVSNTNSNSHANSNTNTGTHNSKSNLNTTNINSNCNSNFTSCGVKDEILSCKEKTNLAQGKISSFNPKPGTFHDAMAPNNTNNFNNAYPITKEDLNNQNNHNINNNYHNTQNLRSEKQEGRKSLRKVIDLKYLIQVKDSASSGANNYSNSNSILGTEESNHNASYANNFENAGKNETNLSSFKSNFLVNGKEKKEDGPVKIQKELGNNLRSLSPYISRLDANNRLKSGVSNINGNSVHESRQNSKNFYEEKKNINANIMIINNENNIYNGDNFINKFESFSTNCVKDNLNPSNEHHKKLDKSDVNMLHLNQNTRPININNNANLNTYEDANCISKNSSLLNSISNIINNYSDEKNNSVLGSNQCLRDMNINESNTYTNSDANNKLMESKNDSSTTIVSNFNTKFNTIANNYNHNNNNYNNYALRNLDSYINHPNPLNTKNVISKNSLLSPNAELYSRKPYNTSANPAEMPNKDNNKTIDLSKISNLNSTSNYNCNENNTNNINNYNLNRHHSQLIPERTHYNYINSAINNTNLPSNNKSTSNDLNSNFVYTSSKSIGKNLQVANKSRDIQIGNSSNLNTNRFNNGNNNDPDYFKNNKGVNYESNLNSGVIYTKNSSLRSVSNGPNHQIENQNHNSPDNNNNLTNLHTYNVNNYALNPTIDRSSSLKIMGLGNQTVSNEENTNLNTNCKNNAPNIFKTTTHQPLKNINNNYNYHNNSLINTNQNNPNEPYNFEFSNRYSNLINPVNINNKDNFNTSYINDYGNVAGKIPYTNSQRETINFKNFSFGSKNIANTNTINSNFDNPFNTLDNPASLYDRNQLNSLYKNPNSNFYANYNQNNQTKIRKKTESSSTQHDFTINLEDLLVIEEKLFEILSVINKGEISYHECFDWWNLYFNCSLCGSFEYYFKDPQNKQIIRDYTFCELIVVCLTYDSCFDLGYYQSINYILKTVFNFLHENFLILCDYFLSKISKESLGNIWVKKLEELILQNLKLKDLKNKHTKEIKNNNKCILDYIRLILKNHPDENISDPLYAFLGNLSKLSVSTLNDFFRSKIIRIENKKASNLASCLVESGDEELKIVEAPYLKDQPLKEYCLVLDLDETLIHFKIDPKDDASGVLRLRPGIYKFLDEVSKYYEIIVFTAATSDYADPILDAIEGNKKYFSYVFYREHTVIEENDYVKDISRIGRDLSKMIIVDNMPQNFRLQKENGILIKTFYGEDQSDKALLELIPILTEMGKIPGKDLREKLALFKDDILKKVSSNLSRK